MKNQTKIKMFQALVFIWLTYGVWCAISTVNNRPEPKPEPVKAQEIQVETWEYPKVIGLIGQAKAESSIEDKIKAVFGPDAPIALAIAKAESGLNPAALGDTDTAYPSAGIFQIRLLPSREITKEQMFNVDENIAYAKMLFDKQGFKPWTMWKNGEYKKFIK